MKTRKKIRAGLLLLVLTAGCADTPPSPARIALGDGPLLVQFRDPGQGMTIRSTNRRVAGGEGTPGSSDDSLARRTRGLVSDGYSYIEQHQEGAGFTTTSGKPVAFGTGWMRFLGNRARETVNLMLTRQGVAVPTLPAVSEVSYAIPARYEISATATAYLAENCGHEASATVEHRAWSQSQVPGTPTSEFMVSSLTFTSPPKSQGACPSEGTKDTVMTPVSGGGAGDRKQTDEWYFCMYEVWYDRSGNEIYRRLLWCEPL